MTRRIDSAGSRRAPDDLVVEEPMSIQLDGAIVSSTMRTPGDDFELAAGFCLTEGVLDGHAVTGIRYCATGSAVETDFNVVTVGTGGRAPIPNARLGSTTSACGICGNDAINELTDRLTTLDSYDPWDLDLLMRLAEAAEPEQRLFEATGSSHAAAAFRRDGTMVVLREDIGRHNAVDKVIGRLLLDDALPASDLALFVSGRASFEMVQKAWAGGFTALVAVSGASSLAVATARRAGLTLVGFARSDRATVYSPDAAV